MSDRHRLIAAVHEALQFAHCPDCAAQAAQGVADFDAHDLVAAANAAGDFCCVAEQADEYEAEFGAEAVRGMLSESAADLRRVLDAGRRRCEERSKGVAPRTRIRQDSLGRWWTTRRPVIVVPRRQARPRRFRPAACRRRGSKRASGLSPPADDPDPFEPASRRLILAEAAQ